MFPDWRRDRNAWCLPLFCYQKLITCFSAAPDRDPGLDTLLDLHGQTLFIDEIGHWVKFVVLRTEVTAERPHRLSYYLLFIFISGYCWKSRQVAAYPKSFRHLRTFHQT